MSSRLPPVDIVKAGAPTSASLPAPLTTSPKRAERRLAENDGSSKLIDPIGLWNGRPARASRAHPLRVAPTDLRNSRRKAAGTTAPYVWSEFRTPVRSACRLAERDISPNRPPLGNEGERLAARTGSTSKMPNSKKPLARESTIVENDADPSITLA